jgi:hypothetical protein
LYHNSFSQYLLFADDLKMYSVIVMLKAENDYSQILIRYRHSRLQIT